MGFAADLAAQALTAGGGDLHKATDCLLNGDNHPPPNSSSPIVQPKIIQFFNLHPKRDQNPPKTNEETEEDKQPISLIHPKKRPRLATNPEDSPKPLPHAPLSEQMRPRVLDEVVGQDHLLVADSLLDRSTDNSTTVATENRAAR
ncbi:hypothetical protein PHJA_002034600 [Phtheirospermum japonicum]|uniref:UBA domain-containing protein n=1 Tax=Phtheirospermum japonicum TaxID=374723 RepID=A0A830CDU3_9LAMI|nr:hypothetical protein PHJA_002034600 [Phtheirospermum japonicum]